MNTTTRSRMRQGSAVAVLIGALLLTGCGSGTPPQHTPSSTTKGAQDWNPGDDPSTEPDPTPPNITTPTARGELPASERGVNRADAAAVAAAAARIWFSWDTATDQSPSDAAARTAPLLAPSYAEAVLSDVAIRPSGQWRSWAAKSAQVTATVKAGGNIGAPDSPTRRYFIFQVTQTARTPAGQRIGTPVVTTAWVITARAATGWEVTQIREQD